MEAIKEEDFLEEALKSRQGREILEHIKNLMESKKESVLIQTDKEEMYKKSIEYKTLLSLFNSLNIKHT